MVASSAGAAVNQTAPASRGPTTTLAAIISGALEQIEVNQRALEQINGLVKGLKALDTMAAGTGINQVAAEAAAIDAMVKRLNGRKRGPKLRLRRFNALLQAARFVQTHPGESFGFEEWFVEITNAMWPDGELRELRMQWGKKAELEAGLGPEFDKSHFDGVWKSIASYCKTAMPRVMQAIRTLAVAGLLDYDAEAGKITHLNRVG